MSVLIRSLSGLAVLSSLTLAVPVSAQQQAPSSTSANQPTAPQQGPGQAGNVSQQTNAGQGRNTGTQTAAAPQASPAELWADFNHYVLVARPKLAKAAAQALLKKANLQTLLKVIESSDYKKNYLHNLDIAKRTAGVAQVAGRLEHRIQSARIAVSRQPERISHDIELLPEGGRPYHNAVQRLTAAGQYAAPQLLATLRNDQKARLHPYVITAMKAIGKPLVAPLSVSLPQLEPATQNQIIQVLAEIGYPLPALPYLAQLKAAQDTLPGVRQAAQRGYQILRKKANLPPNLTAGELFLILGQTRYQQETRGQEMPGYDAGKNRGIVWEFGPRTGLVPAPVPGRIFGDVLAMRATRHSLEINSNLNAALSLWLAANLRRENRLPAGAQDPTYGPQMRPPSFYAMTAGPLRLQDVLSRALRDRDAALALDAISALAKTAGTNALINRGAAQQPLLQALSYPDPRVRFHAAEALANARPQQQFSGANQVVPVLAQAIRPSNTRYALVIANTQNRLNDLLASVGDQGFQAFGGLSLRGVSQEVQQRPAVDLIVIDLGSQRTRRLLRTTRNSTKLGGAPILALTSRNRQLTLRQNFPHQSRLTLSVDTGKTQNLTAAVKQATASAGGGMLNEQQKTRYAFRALRVLHTLALSRSVYNAADAQATLIAALGDQRPRLVADAGKVLALIDRDQAQKALAKAALSAQDELQLSLLKSLAESATRFGNMLARSQTDRLLQLVRSAQGKTAVAAARAHGALTLPTSDAVTLITQQSR